MLISPLPRRVACGILVLAAVVGTLSSAHPAHGQGVPSIGGSVQSNRASISAGSGANLHGVLSVNIASGGNNQQIGSVVIANGATANSGATITQRLVSSARGSSPASATIGANAFSGARGLISINVAAGNDNQEANIAVVGAAFNGSAASDAVLAQTRASSIDNASGAVAAHGSDEAAVAPSAFSNSQGLLQVNVIAGERNSSANIFALTVSAGGKM